MLNKVELIGRIAFEDPKCTGAEGKEYCMFNVSVPRDYKLEGEQYAPEDLIICKAFKNNAKFVSGHYHKGDQIIIVGRIQKDEDRVNEKNEKIYGGLFVNVEQTYFVPGAKSAQSEVPTPNTSGKKKLVPNANKNKPAANDGLPF